MGGVSVQTLLAFAAASMVLLIIPGPTVITVVTQALSHGRRAALASIAGVAFGDLLAATLSTIGVGTLLAASAELFTVVKWAGAAYLVYVGVMMWRAPVSRLSDQIDRAPDLKGPGDVFRAVFLVTVFNPKGIVFFMAFVPQFVNPAHAFGPQAGILIAVFVALGAANAFAYFVAASAARRMIRRPKVLRVATRTGAGFLVAAGLASLFARRVAV